MLRNVNNISEIDLSTVPGDVLAQALVQMETVGLSGTNLTAARINDIYRKFIDTDQTEGPQIGFDLT